MFENYWREHGPYLIGGGAAQVAGWGGLGLAALTEVEFFGGLGLLLVVASGIILFIHSFWVLLIAALVGLAGVTVLGVVLCAVAQLFHPAVLVVLTVAAAAFGVACGAGWWNDHGDDVLNRLEDWTRNCRQRIAARPRRASRRPTLQLRPVVPPITLRHAAPRNRVCRVCGEMVAADQPRCENPDCPTRLEATA